MEKLLDEDEDTNLYNFYKFGPEGEMNENNEYLVLIPNNEVIKAYMDLYYEEFCKRVNMAIQQIKDDISKISSAQNDKNKLNALKDIELEMIKIQSDESKSYKELINNIHYYKYCLSVLYDQYWMSSCKDRKIICDMDIKCAIEIQNTIKALLVCFMKHTRIVSMKIENLFVIFNKLVD